VHHQLYLDNSDDEAYPRQGDRFTYGKCEADTEQEKYHPNLREGTHHIWLGEEVIRWSIGSDNYPHFSIV